MPRGEKMKGRTNNPGGRPRSAYIGPWSSRSAFGLWELPPAERILYDLEKTGGNLTKFLEKACPHVEYRESLLVAVLEELEREGNEEHLERWRLLTARNERARLLLVEQDILERISPSEVKDPEESPGKGRPRKRKAGGPITAQEVATVKFLFQKRFPDKYDVKAPKNTGPTPEEQQAQKELADTLKQLAGGDDVGQ